MRAPRTVATPVLEVVERQTDVIVLDDPLPRPAAGPPGAYDSWEPPIGDALMCAILVFMIGVGVLFGGATAIVMTIHFFPRSLMVVVPVVIVGSLTAWFCSLDAQVASEVRESERRKARLAEKASAREAEERAERLREQREAAEREERAAEEARIRERELAAALAEEAALRALDDEVDALVDLYKHDRHRGDDRWIDLMARMNLQVILAQRDEIVAEAKKFLQNRRLVERLKARSPTTYRRYLGPLRLLARAEELWPEIDCERAAQAWEPEPRPVSEEEERAAAVASFLRPKKTEAAKRLGLWDLERQAGAAIDQTFAEYDDDEREQMKHELKDRLEEDDDEGRTFS